MDRSPVLDARQDDYPSLVTVITRATLTSLKSPWLEQLYLQSVNEQMTQSKLVHYKALRSGWSFDRRSIEMICEQMQALYDIDFTPSGRKLRPGPILPHHEEANRLLFLFSLVNTVSPAQQLLLALPIVLQSVRRSGYHQGSWGYHEQGRSSSLARIVDSSCQLAL
jgi:hypothetical protein